MDFTELFRQLDLPANAQAVPFQNAEDGSDYEVWKVTADGTHHVLKKAKEQELSVYSAFFKDVSAGAPRFLSSARWEGEDYFLMEYVEGEDLRRCTRPALTAALDALIHLQDRYWETDDFRSVGRSFEASLPGRENRGKYLADPELESAYAAFLRVYSTVPRTLCHDDLLPFNVLVREDSATIIDWEVAGILPYPTSLARLIAHGTEEPDAFFYMTEADRAFAIDYYYDHLLREKGIAYDDYRAALDYFLFYEYCEWIMLGVRYEDAPADRCRYYREKAKEHLPKLMPPK